MFAISATDGVTFRFVLCLLDQLDHKSVKEKKKEEKKKRIPFAHNLFGQAKENFVAVGDNIPISCCTCVATGERQLEIANYIDNFDNLCWL